MLGGGGCPAQPHPGAHPHQDTDKEQEERTISGYSFSIIITFQVLGDGGVWKD